MIISKTEFLYRARLDRETLEVWMSEEWLAPQGAADEAMFSDADLARANLIRELQQDLGVNKEGVGVILHLLDQMHSLRKALGGKLEIRARRPGVRIALVTAGEWGPSSGCHILVDISRLMDETLAIDILSALAQPTRLEVFRQLVKNEPEGLPAGEIARRLGVPHNTMSTHLGILERAGLVSSERHSRSIIYRADLGRLRALVVYLLKDCCGGKPELCAPLIEDLTPCCSTEGATCA